MSTTLTLPPAVESPRSAPVGGSLPAILLSRADSTPRSVAMRHYEDCRWREITWAEYATRAARAGLGLVALGVGPGDTVAVLSDNRPEWLIADLGIQGIGAATVGVYPTSPPSEVAYIVGHCDASVLIVEDEEQLDKALEVRDGLPLLTRVVVMDPRMVRRHLADGRVITFAELEELGGLQPVEAWRAPVACLQPDRPATIVYTSGTTGPPKGAMLSHANLLSAARASSSSFALRPTDELLSYLPLCHIFERLNSLVNALWAGFVVNFGQGGGSFAADLRDVQPTILAGVPRVWEKMMAFVETHMADATWAKRRAYAAGLGIGRGVAARRQRGRADVFTRAAGLVASLLVFRSLRDKLGLRRVRIAISGAAPIAPKVLEFFWTLGVPLYEGYGQTENTAVATCTTPGDVRIGKVGRPLPGVEITLAGDGEILSRSTANFLGYLKDPDATAATLDADGWLHTGDVGEVDEDGFLRITDRKKDLIITAGGKNISPSEIENMLKVSPYVREAIVVGDRRKYLTALVGIELDNVGDWATRRFLPYTTYADLASKPEVVRLVEEWVEHVNRGLSQVERIKAFRLLPAELAHENGQLTATLKVKRTAIAEEFASLIEEMYR